MGWIRYASSNRKPTCIERVGRLDSGLNAAMTSWYVENASAAPATTFHASPFSSRLAPVSSNGASAACVASPGTTGAVI